VSQRRKIAKGHCFGGTWTSTKLEVIAQYLTSYSTALKDKPSKHHPFKKAYIDAFAGTGYRDARREEADQGSSQLLLPDQAGQEPQDLLDGSARLALKTDPRFDSYVFIERSVVRSAHLEALESEFPDLVGRTQIYQADANVEIQNLCSKD
jgi:three-Cys-motif partner protein